MLYKRKRDRKMIIKVIYAPVKYEVEKDKCCTADEAVGIYHHATQVFSNVSNYLVEHRDTSERLLERTLEIVRGVDVTRINLKTVVACYVMNDDGKTIDNIRS